ncbi:transposase [Tranquillimonas rosea]|uniref:transposase n=1 Tax=Tranquillimonas rosea TaxID=641238 RepID=UPI001160235D|nr:transposase [Tranquillimonas rosea]
MVDHSFMSQVEVLSVTDTGRRRRWTDAEKVRIVEESYAAPRMAAATARRHDISRSLLTRWRREVREGLLIGDGDRTHFSPVAVTPDRALGPVSPMCGGRRKTRGMTGSRSSWRTGAGLWPPPLPRPLSLRGLSR